MKGPAQALPARGWWVGVGVFNNGPCGLPQVGGNHSMVVGESGEGQSGEPEELLS